jgi:thiamine-monophosphate kinase
LAARGLALLESSTRPANDAARRAVAHFLRPTPRLDLGRALARLAPAVRPRAVTDTSDGLVVDSAKLARASGLGVSIVEAALPLDSVRAVAGERAGDVLTLALEGGEDYELLVAAPSAFERMKIAREAFRRIGAFEAAPPGTVVLERRGGARTPLSTVGFDHRAVPGRRSR